MKDTLRRIRRAVKAALGKDVIFSFDQHVQTERFGSEYGGWTIEAGHLSSSSIVYSFGVGTDVSFDMGLIQRYGLTVHAFDPTPGSIEWVKQQNLGGQFVLHPYGLSDSDGTLVLYPPENPSHISHSAVHSGQNAGQGMTLPVKRLSTILAELGHDRIDLLKMDIEGAEYSVLTDFLAGPIRPHQLLVEFHHRFPEVGPAKTAAAVAALRAAGYGLFAVSASGEELSFVKVSGGASATSR